MKTITSRDYINIPKKTTWSTIHFNHQVFLTDSCIHLCRSLVNLKIEKNFV